MDLGLSGKVAVVTGSARGLGAATARRLAQEGAKVIVTDILAEEAEATARALRGDGMAAHCVVADITRAADVQRLVDEAVAHFGGVHVLVNNACFPRDKYLVTMSEEDWDLFITVMMKGAFLPARAVMPHFIQQGWGRAINISSRAHLGNPTQCNYSAAKAGLIGMAKALAQEEGRYGVTVNCIAPGFMETEMVKALPTYETIKERALQLRPIKRAGHPDAVAYLASERAGGLHQRRRAARERRALRLTPTYLSKGIPMRRAAIVSPLRTPVGAFGGALKGVPVEDLGATVVRAILQRTGLDPVRVDDVVFAQSYASGETPCTGRWVALQAGLPIEVAGMQLDRRCGGGVQALATAAMTVQPARPTWYWPVAWKA